MSRPLSEILGTEPGQPVELVSVRVDHEARKIRVEFLGANGVEVRELDSSEARHIAAELIAWTGPSSSPH